MVLPHLHLWMWTLRGRGFDLCSCSLDCAVGIACWRLLRVPSPTVVINPELCVIPAMPPSYCESGRGSRDGGGHGRPHENQRGSRPRAVPGAFEIGDNVDWHRLRPPVYRGSTFRCRLLELSVAVHLYGEIQATLRAIREISMNPKPPWSGEAAADACADQEHCQIGGFLRFSNGDIRWFSERWPYQDFNSLDIPVATDMQKDISSYETLAQIGLLFTLCHLMPAQRFALTLRSQSDNTTAESTADSPIHHKIPFMLLRRKIMPPLSGSACSFGCLPHPWLCQRPGWQNFSNGFRTAVSRWLASQRPHPYPIVQPMAPV